MLPNSPASPRSNDEICVATFAVKIRCSEARTYGFASVCINPTWVRQAAEHALRAKRITFEESRQLLRRYEEGLSGYTYLEQD